MYYERVLNEMYSNQGDYLNEFERFINSASNTNYARLSIEASIENFFNTIVCFLYEYFTVYYEF